MDVCSPSCGGGPLRIYQACILYAAGRCWPPPLALTFAGTRPRERSAGQKHSLRRVSNCRWPPINRGLARIALGRACLGLGERGGVCCVATELPSGRPRVRRRRCREADQQHRTRHDVAAGPVASRTQTERESRTATWSPRAKRDTEGSRGPERTGKKYHTDCAKHVLGTHVMPVLNTMLHPWPRIVPRSSRLRRRGPPKDMERGGPRKSVEEWSHVEWS